MTKWAETGSQSNLGAAEKALNVEQYQLSSTETDSDSDFLDEKIHVQKEKLKRNAKR